MGYNEPTDYDYDMICGFVNKWGQQKPHSDGIFFIGSINFKITGFEANVGHIVTIYWIHHEMLCNVGSFGFGKGKKHEKKQNFLFELWFIAG